MTLDERLVQIVPSARQLAHQQLEFYAFIHFTVNAFTDREWGDGTEDPALFAPSKLDADQWAEAIRAAGMRGMVLTCKHHDGFCLWPSRYTLHSVASSPFCGGKGDVVRAAAEACRRHGLKFGVYLSPWDRNCPLYGSGKAYDDFFVGQLTELLSDYGEIFSVWFDGACGEGPNGKKQVYDWDRYYAVVRALQPGACISVCGPDIRWCGNEAGHTRASEWSVVPERMRDTERVSAKSQRSAADAARLRKLTASDEDLGSRTALENEPALIWYPAEVNTSIRPGWFWHEKENDRVRSLEDLWHVYLGSVGGNATFLLNIPPTNEGLLHENDVARLRELGAFLKNAFRENLAPLAKISADSAVPGHGPEAALTEGYDSYFAPIGQTAEITLRWRQPASLGYLVLQENITMSQRVERFAVDAVIDGVFRPVGEGTVIGYKRILPLEGIQTRALRIRITDARCFPTLSFIGVYAANKS